MAELCDPTLSDPAVAFVNGGYGTFLPLATAQLAATQNSVNAITALTIGAMPFNVSFDFDGAFDNWRQPEPPDRPDRDDFIAPALTVADAPEFTAGNPTPDSAPTFTAQDPVLAIGPRPTRPAIADPGDAPVLAIDSAPTPPDYEMPEVPTLEDLDIPERRTFTIPTFDAELADPDFTVPAENWTFTPEEYASDLLDSIKSKLSAIMDGGTGLPVAIEQALFDRGAARVYREETRAAQQAIDEYGTRGFDEPSGVLTARLAEIRQEAQDRRATHARDIAIHAHEKELEQLRFAVTQGIALEGVLIGLHAQMQDLVFRSLSFARDTAIAIFNARVTLFNATAQAFESRARVFEARIRGVLAEVEVLKAEIDAERLRGEINEQRVRIYTERLRALSVMADLYRSQVQGFEAAANVEIKKMDGYKATVEAYAERVRAWGVDVDAYGSAVTAELGKVQVHRTLADVFGIRTNAWQTRNQLFFDKERLSIQTFEARVKAWDGTLRKQLAELEAFKTQAAALASYFQTEGSIFAAEGQVEAAASAARDRTLQLGIEKERARTDVAIKAAEIRVQENIALTQTLLEALKTIAQVNSQLAASTMSAVNFSAGVSSSTSNSKSCSTSFNLDGEVADAL